MEPGNEFSFKKIMVIEDSEIDRYVMSQIMQRCRFAEDIIMLSSASDALLQLEQLSTNPDELPQLIFLDIHMPKMNGFAFLAELKTKYDHLKEKMAVVILTISLDPINLQTSHSYSNVKMYLNKPLNIEMLEQVRSSVLFK